MTQDKGWRFTGNERKYIEQVLSSGFGASESGTMNERLEKKFAEINGLKYAITANSGTSTLHIALNSFGVGPGDEVIIPALTVAMCGFSVWQCGAVPVYADVLPDTFLINPKDVEEKITNKTKAIMPVHMYGNMCDMNSIMEIAKKNNLSVVEDCAECQLSTDDKGQIAGTVGDVGSWSFENSKHLTTGDGGIVATNNELLAAKMRKFASVGFKNVNATSGKVRISRDNFQNPNYERHDTLAYNYRFPELCAAVGLAQCERIQEFVNLRIKMAESYLQILNNSSLFIPQKVQDGYTNTYYTFAARFLGNDCGISWYDFRKKYMEFGGDGIYAAHQLVYNEPCFRQNNIGYGKAPVSEKLQQELMLFTTNQRNEDERKTQINALQKTLDYFK
jgi:perosamine synthetase|tara:strand:+ start:109 stop:1281 length:1173 start_codon:yes stop_codon:yes gene_type:complete